ncbi:MAG: FAD-dependent oxidoreductase [Thermodesulfobacteriota bacterium]
MISDINIRVDRDKCHACGLCVERCIMDNLRLSVAPCRQACPLHMNCQGYVRLLAQGKEGEAVEEIRPFSPFLNILARVCLHPCEAVCERGRLDGPVHIRALKKYLADRYPHLLTLPRNFNQETGWRAAVIGSGPAGLMAAHELRARGHQVTVFEKDPEPGGLMRYALPSFRLPVREVEKTVEILNRLGVEFKTGVQVDLEDGLNELETRFGAVVLALGAGAPVKPEVPGQDLESVVQALDLLRLVKDGRRTETGRRVIVLGGGNTAVDAALTCRKLGAEEVRIVSLERPREMPVSPLALEEAKEEGIKLEPGWGAIRFNQSDNHSVEMELSRCLAVFDDQGRFAPELEPFPGRKIEADLVVLAMGQKKRPERLPLELVSDSDWPAAVDPLTLQISARPKVFVCGDVVSGPSSVVHSLASGQEAAVSADRFLRGEGLRWDRGFWNGARVKEYESRPERARGGPRAALPRRSPRDRRLELETELTFSAREARQEAERCLSCGRSFEMNQTCWYCLPCEIVCPSQALEVRMPYLVR